MRILGVENTWFKKVFMKTTTSTIQSRMDGVGLYREEQTTDIEQLHV